MKVDIFGFQFANDEKEKETLKTIELKSISDPDAINTSKFYGEHGILEYNNSFFVPTEDIERIKQYRRLAQTPEISQMLTEIFNEIFILDVENKRAFDINFYDDSTISQKVKTMINEEVENLYNIMNFKRYGVEWFSDWYIDSKFNVQVVINEENHKEGIRKVVPIDPLKLRKVRVIPDPESDGSFDINEVQEYFLYSNTFDETLKYGEMNTVLASSTNYVNNMKISKDSIVQVMSGIRDADTGKTIGYLHKTIVPYNNLKMMEEAMIIYRVVRAPMRRAFYFDVSRMRPQQAEEYMKNQMKRFKTRFVYNPKTGTSNSQTHIQSMIEDYYLPRHSEGKTTEIQTIDGQSSQEILEEVEYLKDKLFKAGNVPLSRLQDQQNTFVFGKTDQIDFAEYRFRKFLNRVRSHFMILFDELLKRQLILKNIIKEEEWEEIHGQYYWQYTEDNAFVEWKEAEKQSSRLDQLERIVGFSGRFYSDYWIKKNVLKQTDDEIEEIEQQNKQQPDFDAGENY